MSSSSESSSEFSAENLKQLDSEEGSYFLHIYSDLEYPVEILQVCYRKMRCLHDSNQHRVITSPKTTQ